LASSNPAFAPCDIAAGARKTDPGAVYSDWGEPLPAEAGLAPHTRDDSQRIMRISESFLGERLDTLIAANEVRLTRYGAVV
jgi:hypothetical protein